MMLETVSQTQIKGVILAAGRGVRAYPATKYIPKALLDISGKSLIERNIDIMRAQLLISEIIVVVGYLGEQIEALLTQSYSDLQLTFVRQKQQNGIGAALLEVASLVGDGPFMVMLGDEFYLDSNHRQLADYLSTDVDAVLMFKEELNKAKVANNYTGLFEGERIVSLVEKPENPDSPLMGTGTYFFLNSKIFNYIRNTPPSQLRGEVEITDALSNMAKEEIVHRCILSGTYLNVNSVDDLNMANYLYREKHFDTYQVSVVIPAYNEAETIAAVVMDYRQHDCVDEVIVVDNNSKDQTAAVAQNAGARVVTEYDQGYGCALRRGLDEARGDIIVLSEADGSFQARDVHKFIHYLKDCDMVIGTRTTRQMIEQGANMHGILRWGNVIVGKLVEALWWGQEPRFTDVGCTYRAIWKSSYHKIRPHLNARGPDFAPEMMIAILICRRRIIEIPVSYRRRLYGESKHSGYFLAQARTAIKMLKLIFQYRLKY